MKAKFLALAALLFGLAACHTEPEGFDVNLGGEQTATISVVLPEDAITRAEAAENTDSAWSGLQNLKGEELTVTLYIFDENGNPAKTPHTATLVEGELTANFDVRLVPDRHYTFAVWAGQNNENPQNPQFTLNQPDEKDWTITLADWAAMDESRDAFTGIYSTKEKGKVFTSSSNITLNLTRPFAKLRVVTTDMEWLNNINVTPAYATVTYEVALPKTFNAYTETIGADVFDKKIHNKFEIKNYTKDATGEMTLFTDYILVPASGIVKFTLDVFEDEACTKPIKSNAFTTDIPVKRNNLTTIKGNVLTEGNDIKVEVKPEFGNGTEWNPSDDKYDVEVFSGVYNTGIVLSKSGTYIFEDLKVNAAEAVVVNEGVEAVIAIKGYAKLNGKQGIVVEDGAKLTIEGISETRSAERGGSLEVVATEGSAIGGKFITINNLAALTAKAGNVNCAYGIGAIDAEVTINNTKIDYVSGAFVQPLCVNDPKYGKSEPEGASAIGGKKVVLNDVEVVKAEGGSKAAAIGNRYWQDTEVVIKNSTLRDVFGGNASAAIGGSRYGSDSKHNISIEIENSTIKNAVGGQFGAGIGSGYDTHCNQQNYTAVNEIVIKASTINAKGGKYAAGIGTGFHSAYLTGSIDAESTITSVAGDEVWYKGEYTTAQNLGYGVVDPAREFSGDNATVEFTVAGVVIPSPIVNATYVTVNSRDEFQAAINGAKEGENMIFFGANIEGDVTVVQKPGVKITIEGENHKYNGQIKVHSNSNHYADAALTIKNVNFETATAINFIEALENGSERYSTNITVENCTFTATDETVNTVGLQIKASKNAKVLNCTANGLHSLVQAQSCDEKVEVIGCTINGKNGVAFKQVKAATVDGTTIVATGYGIRFDGNIDNYGIVVKNNNITANQPFIVRKMTGANNTITLEGENTLNTEAGYQIVITNGQDDAEYVKPTGTYTLTGADKYVVYPRNIIVSADLTIEKAINAGCTNIILAEGIHVIPVAAQRKTLTFVGNGDPSKIVIATNTSGSYEGCNYNLQGSTVTFENITITTDNNIYTGYAGCDATFNNCIINNTLFLYGKMAFNNCTFNASGDHYNIWTWAAPEVEFENCVFNCDGKALLLYGGADTKLYVNDCTFNDYDGLVDETKAAIEIGNDYGRSYEVYVNNIEVNGFAINPKGTCTGTNIWGNKNSMTKDNLKVVIDGVEWDGYEVVAPGLTKKSASEYNVYNANGLVALNTMMQNKTAGNNVIVNIMADIDFTGNTWTPVDSHADSAFTFSTLNGNNHTISHLTINGQAMFTRFAGSGNVTIKNVTFDYANVNSNGALNTSILTVQAYQNVLLDNVDVKNSAITGGYKVAPLMGTVYNENPSTVTATLKNCDVENTIVTATLHDFCTTGMVAFVYEGNNDRIEFENCTIKDVKLYARPGGYAAHAAIYVNDADTDDCFNEAEGVTVTNVTFEAI